VASARADALPEEIRMVHEPLAASFGALVEGVALAGLDNAGFRALYALWQRQHLVVLRGHGLDREGFHEFAERFGPVDPLPDLGGAETNWGSNWPGPSARPSPACCMRGASPKGAAPPGSPACPRRCA
jgi:hypothetical protein